MGRGLDDDNEYVFPASSSPRTNRCRCYNIFLLPRFLDDQYADFVSAAASSSLPSGGDQLKRESVTLRRQLLRDDDDL